MNNPELTRSIIEVLRKEHLPAGFHVREQWLANILGVSRSPIRTALRQLEQMGIVRSERHQGYFLEIASEHNAFENLEIPESDVDKIYRRIVGERFVNLLGDQISIGDLLQRYGTSRAVLKKVLNRMQEEGLIEKTSGHGWSFGPTLNDETSYLESYRYRLLVEPASMREPSFSISASSIERLVDAQTRLMANGPDKQIDLGAFLDADASFHNTLADASGNRFLIQTIRRQTRLRRISEYEKYSSQERLRNSINEHLSILKAIQDGQMIRAATRMAAHIESSGEERPNFRKVRVLAHRRLTRQ